MGLLQPHGRSRSTRREARLSGRRIIVHSLDHARAALEAAAALGIAVTLASAAGAAGYAGALWWKALIEAARREHPEVAFIDLLDCGEEPGTALGALKAGIKHLRFTGSEAALARLAAIAAQSGAAIESGAPPPVLDLLDARDPRALCRAYLAEDETAG
jgi:acyl-CoA reductase-like NAD-dependent aldehyde dehydrogenase